MKLRPKIIALIAALFALFGVAQMLIQNEILLPGFAELERQSARNEMARAVRAFDGELDLLSIVGDDWGDWSDTYRFMGNHDLRIIEASISPSEIAAYHIDAVAFADQSGKFVWTRSAVQDAAAAGDIDLFSADALPPGPVWRTALQAGIAVRGLVSTNRGLMLVAGHPVLDGRAQGPSRGMVLLGRFLTPERISAIARQAQTTLTLMPLRGADGRAQDPVPPGASRAGDDRFLVTDQVTDVYRVLDDIDARPLLALHVAAPRQIAARGRQVVAYADLFLTLAGAAVVLLLFVTLNQSVLKPLARITRRATEIGEGVDYSARLNLQRPDELGRLAAEIDRMVGNLAEARRQLVDQSFLAGVAENSAAVLHDLGNAMTPLCVKVAVLQQALQNAPATEIEMALAELGRPTQDLARVASLERYVHLASRELATVVASARLEADRLAEHAQAIRSLLGEQTRNLRAASLLEDCTLAELLQQGIELVPEALRERLSIETDASCRNPGTLRVARTIMQQVIRNIVVNAAEAVRDAGPGNGVLRISTAGCASRAATNGRACALRTMASGSRPTICSGSSRRASRPSSRRATRASVCTGAATPSTPSAGASTRRAPDPGAAPP